MGILEGDPMITVPVFVVVAAALGILILAIGSVVLLRRRRATFQLSRIQDWSQRGISPWGALVVSSSGQVLACDHRTALQLGVTPGRKAPPALVELVRKVVETQVPKATNLSLSGEEADVRVEASPAGFVGRTEGVLLLLRRIGAKDELMARHRKLLNDLLHAVRTPVTNIKLFVALLSRKAPGIEDHRQAYEDAIARESGMLGRTVDDFLSLLGVESSVLNPLPVNPRAVTEEAISAIYDLAEEKGVSILLEASPDLPRILADRRLLQKTLTNLLDNAVKFSPAGESVEVALAPCENGVRISVCDCGPGIPPHDLPHLFEPFFVGGYEYRLQSSGLGLAIVKSILDQHGTEIEVESEPGKGTCFAFILQSAKSSQE